jgi:hypothetical protein
MIDAADVDIAERAASPPLKQFNLRSSADPAGPTAIFHHREVGRSNPILAQRPGGGFSMRPGAGIIPASRIFEAFTRPTRVSLTIVANFPQSP